MSTYQGATIMVVWSQTSEIGVTVRFWKFIWMKKKEWISLQEHTAYPIYAVCVLFVQYFANESIRNGNGSWLYFWIVEN